MHRLRSACIGTLIGGILALLGAHEARAILSPSGIDPRLRLDWEVVQTRTGRPQVQGYIYNDYGRPALNVRLVVETLDASGQVTDLAYGYVFGVVPVFNRTLFDVPLKTTGASYRIRVTSFEWKDGGSGS